MGLKTMLYVLTHFSDSGTLYMSLGCGDFFTYFASLKDANDPSDKLYVV